MMRRRGLLTGLAGLVVAPAIVRAEAIMPVKALPKPVTGFMASAFGTETIVKETPDGLFRWVTTRTWSPDRMFYDKSMFDRAGKLIVTLERDVMPLVPHR